MTRYAITDRSGAVVVVHNGDDVTAALQAEAEGGTFVKTGIEDMTGYRWDGKRLRAPTEAQKRGRAFDDAARKVRVRRDAILRETDWTQVQDAPVDRAAWAVYRQALRDISKQPGFPHQITWPVEPGKEE